LKNPAVFYGVIALGVIIMVAGVYMRFGMHPSFHGKAYAVIAVGVVALIAGVAAMVVLKPKASA
jgi:uncharacterized membrane protein HdeD (DUF308 family)